MRIIIALILLTSTAHAASDIVNARVGIIQCGPREDLAYACQNIHPLCCDLIQPAAGDESDQSETQTTDEYYIYDVDGNDRPEATVKIENYE